MRANIYVHSIIFIAEFPMDGIQCIDKLKSHCANMIFSEKVDMTGLFNRSHIKEGNLQLITLKYSRMHMLYQFLWEIPTQDIN